MSIEPTQRINRPLSVVPTEPTKIGPVASESRGVAANAVDTNEAIVDTFETGDRDSAASYGEPSQHPAASNQGDVDSGRPDSTTDGESFDVTV